jgi:hypothetical protein
MKCAEVNKENTRHSIENISKSTTTCVPFKEVKRREASLTVGVPCFFTTGLQNFEKEREMKGRSNFRFYYFARNGVFEQTKKMGVS